MSILSTSLSRIKESPTIAITQKARLLKESGKEVIALASGEPDFDTPENIKEAAIKAIKEGQTKYTAVDGTPELKKAIISKFKRENNLNFDLENITVGTGGKQVIYNCILATINPGDEVIIPAPYWVSYPDIVLLAGGVPKFVECDEQSDFKISAEQLEKLITNKTKWFILNSPANPTGMCYSRSELIELVKVLNKHKHVNILTDDIYEHIIYQDEKGGNDSKFINILEIDNSLKDRTIVINGVSKAYAMTGWRIGYAAAPKELIKAIQKIQSQSTTNPSSISQVAAVEALNGDQSFISVRAQEFKKRRDFIVKALNNIKGLSCVNPQGAFYVFPNCKKVMNKKTLSGKIIKDDTDFATYLLEETGVAIVQGSAFGLEGYFRISYATSMKILEKAMLKIKTFCESLS
jgi:aspartate aminotransferase